MTDEKPAFTEDDVQEDFVEAIDSEVVSQVGVRRVSFPYEWPDDDSNDEDCSWPFVVFRDGREFEVDIDVRVVELTPERKAQRAAKEQRVLEMLARHSGWRG
jgi:hypothetical protein